MYRRQRKAIDAAGHEVEVTERQESDEHHVRPDGTICCVAPAKFFGPDGQRLVADQDGSFWTPRGTQYRLVD